MPRDRSLRWSSSSSSVCVGLGSDTPDADRQTERERGKRENFFSVRVREKLKKKTSKITANEKKEKKCGTKKEKFR